VNDIGVTPGRCYTVYPKIYQKWSVVLLGKIKEYFPKEERQMEHPEALDFSRLFLQITSERVLGSLQDTN
jgi:hypothetical protein